MHAHTAWPSPDCLLHFIPGFTCHHQASHKLLPFVHLWHQVTKLSRKISKALLLKYYSKTREQTRQCSIKVDFPPKTTRTAFHIMTETNSKIQEEVVKTLGMHLWKTQRWHMPKENLYWLNANCIFSKLLKWKVKLFIIPRKGFWTALVLSDHVGWDGNEFINQKLNKRCQTRVAGVEEKGKMEREVIFQLHRKDKRKIMMMQRICHR